MRQNKQNQINSVVINLKQIFLIVFFFAKMFLIQKKMLYDNSQF